MTLTAVDIENVPDLATNDVYRRALRYYPAQALVNVKALADNMAHMRDLTTAKAREAGVKAPEIMGVVKADAYGHGLIATALSAMAGGATWLGVAQAREALKLRRAGIGADRVHILCWMFSALTSPFDELITHDIDIALGSLHDIEIVRQVAHQLGKPARVHIQVETGFGRNGFTSEQFDDALVAIKAAYDQGDIDVVGVLTHLSVADAPQDQQCVDVTNIQRDNFFAMIERMERVGIHPRIRHMANTAATLTRPDMYCDLVRPGIGLYGYEPDTAMGMPDDFGLTPAMTLQAQLGTVKDLPAGHAISYGRTYITEHDTSTADMPIGYADGIHRSASGFNPLGSLRISHWGGPVAIRLKDGSTKVVHIAGRVCMDQAVLDLDGNAQELGVSEGDTVKLFGPGQGAVFGEPTADDWARCADTISYEIFTCLRNRIPRLYYGVHQIFDQNDRDIMQSQYPQGILS